MSAADEAREVEVVRDAVTPHLMPVAAGPEDADGILWLVADREKGERIARSVLADLGPIRAAERQEAAREAFEEGVDAGRDDCCGIPWDQPKWIDRPRPTNPYRSDGVAGRRET